MSDTDYATIYKSILAEVDAAEHVMLVMHQKPDGDTAGACLAMANYLDTIEKPHTCFCVDELSPMLRFLPGQHKVTTTTDVWHPDTSEFDLVIVFDAGDLRYAGIADYVDSFTDDCKIINIDHHATNTGYGHHNLVVSTASSTCEIVHELLESINVLNKEMATCLMTGLMTDTGGFTNLATTASAIDTAGKLLLRGVNLKHISNNTMENRRVSTLKLWGRALERLTVTSTGIIVTGLTYVDIEDCGALPEDLDGVANFLNSLDSESEQGQNDAVATLLLTETIPGKVKGSFRTTNPLIDVSKYATILGGGGHKKAAGFMLDGHVRFTHNQWHITAPTE